MSLSREQFLSKFPKVKVKKLDIPDMDDGMYIRMMNGLERQKYETEISKVPMTINYRGLVCAMCISDEQGNRLFADSDADTLATYTYDNLDKITEAVFAWNEIRPEDIEEKKSN